MRKMMSKCKRYGRRPAMPRSSLFARLLVRNTGNYVVRGICNAIRENSIPRTRALVTEA